MPISPPRATGKKRAKPTKAQSTFNYSKYTAVKPSSGTYGHKWRLVRAAHLAESPLCVACLAKGATVPATEVDHITPHRGDMTLFWDVDNWQSLCKPCHSKKTASGR